MTPPRFAYLSNSELLRAAQDPMVDTLDREALLDLVVELTAALEDEIDMKQTAFHPRRRINGNGPNHIRPIHRNKETPCLSN